MLLFMYKVDMLYYFNVFDLRVKVRIYLKRTVEKMQTLSWVANLVQEICDIPANVQRQILRNVQY